MMRTRVLERGLGRLGAGAVAAGTALAVTGAVLVLTTASADAATIICGSTFTVASLAPGDSGSCSVSYSETATQLGNPFTVTLDVDSISNSGGGASGSGIATEALFDATPTGLQITVTDQNGTSFGTGTPSCSGSYPDAASCSGHDDAQPVPGATGVRSWSDTFTITWSLPLAAGNPYQGGGAQVTLTPYYSGTPAAPVQPSASTVSPTSSASPTASPSASPSGGSLPSTGGTPPSIPSTGAGLSLPGLTLVTAGVLLMLLGLGLVAIARSRHGRGPERPPR